MHNYGNKVGRLLARLCSGQHPPTHIGAIQYPSGSLPSGSNVNVPSEINTLLTNYYTSFYAEDPINVAVANSLLEGIHLSTLSQAQLDTLNVCLRIKSLPAGKAPGPDGFTVEFYKLTTDFITETLHRVYEEMWAAGQYLPSGSQAHIKLLANIGKYPLLPGSYRLNSI